MPNDLPELFNSKGQFVPLSEAAIDDLMRQEGGRAIVERYDDVSECFNTLATTEAIVVETEARIADLVRRQRLIEGELAKRPRLTHTQLVKQTLAAQAAHRAARM